MVYDTVFTVAETIYTVWLKSSVKGQRKYRNQELQDILTGLQSNRYWLQYTSDIGWTHVGN